MAEELRKHADFTIAMLGGFVAKVSAIILNTYGTLVLTDSYKARGLTEQDAKDHLSVIFLIGNILSCFSCLLFGYLSDYIKIYKLSIVINIIILTFFILLVYTISDNEESLEKLGRLFDVSLIIAYGCYVSTFMNSITTLSKLCSEKTRGSMFALNGLIGGIGVLVV